MADKDDSDAVDKNGKGADDMEKDLNANASAFEALERDFQDVLSELMGDQSLEKFRLEYEKLHRALKKSHDQEKRLVKKCRELNTEIVNNQAKIKTALRLSQEDQKTIGHLQKEMEKTWKLVYMAQEKENRAKENISALKEEMVNLSKLVERSSGMSANQENTLKELQQAKDEFERQVEEQASQISMMVKEIEEQRKVEEALIVSRDDATRMVGDFRERLLAKEAENDREIRRREKTHKELQGVRTQLDNLIKKDESISEELTKNKLANAELEKNLTDAKATMEKYLKDYDLLYSRTQKVTEDLEKQIIISKKYQAELLLGEKEVKIKRIEIGRIATEKGILQRKLSKAESQVIFYKQLADEGKAPLAAAQEEVAMLKEQIIEGHKREAALQRESAKISLEKNAQVKAAELAEEKVKEKTELVHDQEFEAKKLANEVHDQRAEVQHLRKAIFSLEKDRERLGNEVSASKNLYVQASEDLRLREVHITELNKKIMDWEQKLKQQQKLYESVRTDRNHYSKELVEAQDEVAELNKKYKIMVHQIDQLKEEVSTKDQALVKEHHEFLRAEKLRENLLSDLNRKSLLISQDHDLINRQDAELKKLTAALQRMDEESLAQKKEYDHIINERDILGMQLIRRNDELALLYDKLRIQRSALNAGEIQYRARVDDIRLLKIRVKDLAREASLGKGSGAEIEALKRETLQLQKELLQEKTKVTALSEELENPMNVHRWRKLEGSDPATFELIQKIQTLQRRLISKTEEVVEKGLQIQEKDKLYSELKIVLSRQPGPEVAEQLNVYQETLKQKMRQLKSMASEVNMYQAQVNEYKYEMERVNRELLEFKRKYYLKKRKDELEREQIEQFGQLNSQSFGTGLSESVPGSAGVPVGVSMSATAPHVLQSQQLAAAKSARTRFAGGGFAVK